MSFFALSLLSHVLFLIIIVITILCSGSVPDAYLDPTLRWEGAGGDEGNIEGGQNDGGVALEDLTTSLQQELAHLSKSVEKSGTKEERKGVR